MVKKNKVHAGNVVDYIMDYEAGDQEVKDTIDLFSYLIKTRQCYRLQGHYGRTACSIIKAGIIDTKGKIKTNKLKELIREEHGE